MVPALRQRLILERLEKEVSVATGDLVKAFNVTAMTVWRDLKFLEDRGLVKRVRGGALREDVLREPTFEAKLARARVSKARLADWAVANLVRDGQTLFLEGGTTIATLASRLRGGGLKVMTNSLEVLNRIHGSDDPPTAFCSGGLLRPESSTMVGKEAVTYFGRRKADWFFMSATAVGPSGLRDPNPQEIEVKRAMAAGAGQVAALVDQSKWREDSVMEVLAWRQVSVLVTDAPPPDEAVGALEAAGVRAEVV